MAEFIGTKLVTKDRTVESLASSEASERAAPIEGFKPANWELTRRP